MEDFSTNPVYLEVKRKFLESSESNRATLLGLISDCLDHFPQPSKTPYLGTNREIDFSFVKKYENLPTHPQPASDVLNGAMNFFQRSILWHSPQALQNITPPPLLEAVAVSTIANLYNLNLLWDYVSAGVQEAEQQIVRQISKLAGWTGDSDGVFTYGGKGCLTYAIRVGLNRCCPRVAKESINSVAPVVITTKFNHYIIESVCAWLGLGKDACIRVKTYADETIDLNDLKNTLNKVLSEKKSIACIILSGGSTINLNIDRVDSARNIIEEICSRFNLNYKPFIYFDTVVSWPWMFYKDYDFEKNEIKIPEEVLPRIKKVAEFLRTAEFADAIGVDFHKIGFAPYNNSAFFVKNKVELHSVVSDAPIIRERGVFGNNFLQHHTIEHSRSAAPVMAAWTILQSLGVQGFQMYLAQMMIVGDIFRSIIPKYGFELLNPQSLCYASVYYPIPPQGPKNFNEMYDASLKDTNYATQYIYELSKYFSLGGKDSFDQIDVGFLKNLQKSKLGADMSAIRIFPMSPHITAKEAEQLSHQLGKMKEKFDKEFLYIKSDAPEVVHK
jgi:glutamate/tyrosine decarboxylase-like PLP-dependent enzyme